MLLFLFFISLSCLNATEPINQSDRDAYFKPRRIDCQNNFTKEIHKRIHLQTGRLYQHYDFNSKNEQAKNEQALYNYNKIFFNYF